MSNKMLIDATHPEETRVVIVRDKRVEDFDFETASKKPLRGNIYLAKVTRVEPSLQAAFIEYGGNRHGFLAFSEIHPDYYQIPQADRAALIAELDAAAEAEERGGRERDRGRRRGGRGDRRDARPSDTRASAEERGEDGGSVVEVVEDEEADEVVEAGAEAAQDAEATAGDERDADDGVEEADPARRAVEEAEDAAWLRAVETDAAEEDDGEDVDEEAVAAAQERGVDAGGGESFAGFAASVEAGEGGDEVSSGERGPVPGARREVSRTGEVTAGDIAGETEGGISSDEAPAALDRARRQVEETIEADTEAAIDNPIREVEVPDPSASPDADSAERTGSDLRDPPVARSPAQAAGGEAAPAEAPAKPRRTRKPASAKPAAAKPKKAAEAPATATDDAADAAVPEDGGEPTKKRRAAARRTTKKSDTGLADPMVVDDEDAAENVESVGGSADALDEMPERRRLTPKKQYKIQEVIKRRQILLVQVVKEERGTKGAALTTYLSLAGRYSVLMPNTDRGGGVSRKITDQADRRRLKELVEELEVPEGMGIILRTAGANRTKMEIRRDFEYLIRLWESVRDLTLKSIAPALVYEEGNLVKRSIRDQYSKEIEEVQVAGEAAYSEAREFMKMLMPGHEGAVKPYRDPAPIFAKFGIEPQLDAMFSPQVTLPAKGYIVINPTEALVSIDVNSGRSTKEHSIEDTALKTNLEAADEVARQLRLRDLAGLIVIDFIDMDEKRHNRQVEARLKNALRLDRSRIQIGRISPFGLLEMSRQRMRQGMIETSMVPCATCGGTGHVRSTQSVALHCLRMLEAHLLKHADHNVALKTTSSVALYILNQKRAHLNQLEERFALEIEVHADEALSGQHLEIVPGQLANKAGIAAPLAQRVAPDAIAAEELEEFEVERDDEPKAAPAAPAAGGETQGAGERGGRRRRRRRRRGGNGEPRGEAGSATAAGTDESDDEFEADAGDEASFDEERAEDEFAAAADEEDAGEAEAETIEPEAFDADAEGSRRRGRRGGRRHRREGEERAPAAPAFASDAGDELLSAADEEVAEVDDLAEEVASGVNNGAAPEDAAVDEEVAVAAAEQPARQEAAPEQKSDPRPPRAGWWRSRFS